MNPHQRQSILCPNCRKLISAYESRCPYCGIRHPGAWWKNNPWTQGLSSTGQLVKWIIAANVVMYAISLLLNPSGMGFSLNPFSFLSPSNQSLALLGATGTIPIDRLHRWWTLVSANYLHGGIIHILFNMIALRQIAPLVVQEYGGHRMFVLYTLGGIAGFLISYLAGVAFTIGASAAICSLIGASLYFGKSRGGTYGQAVYKQVGGWVVAIFVFGFLVPGINNWGHGGGIAAGLGLGFLMGYQEKRRENLFHKILAGLCALLTVVILGWAVLSSLYYRFGG